MELLNKTILLYFLFLIVFSSTDLYADDINDGREENVNAFANQELLAPVFEKLYALEEKKQGKINIVHIGDSHIQADFFTNAIREILQAQFGNGGVGFTFPYALVKTNGPRNYKYACNSAWRSLSNVSPIADVGVGLSGIALYTSSEDFVFQLSANDGYGFNNVKIIYPTVDPQYKMSVTAEPLQTTATGSVSSTTGFSYHKVKNGESLSVIARKHKATVSQIKSANGLKSDMIRAGKTLKIPVKGVVVNQKTEKSNIKGDSIDYVNMQVEPYFSSFTSDTSLNRITILPADQRAMYNLNGFVIENNQPGIIYHSIGVNGARMIDYAKYPLFFEQLPILQPDLIILSFGTNESFGRMSETEYVEQLKDFVEQIQKKNKDAVILAMTPPPSMFRRTRTNTYVSSYSAALMSLNYLPVWDLFSRMGGASSIAPRGLFAKMMDKRKVHYTVPGYQAQGELFVADFMNAYDNFKKNKTN